MKCRKRPVVVDAEQTSERVVIRTLEGDMKAEPGDWIVTGVKGERYPVKPDVFAATYEPAGERDDPIAEALEIQLESSRADFALIEKQHDTIVQGLRERKALAKALREVRASLQRMPDGATLALLCEAGLRAAGERTE